MYIRAVKRSLFFLVTSVMLAVFGLLPVTQPIVYAQSNDDQCTVQVEQALTIAAEQCSTLGANQACYGNIDLTVTTRDGFEAVVLEQPGDTAELAALNNLILSPFDLERSIWGISMMQVRANIPGTLPGQLVQIIAFGDVSIENSGEDINISLPATVTASSNVRSGPSTENTVISGVSNGDTLTVNGRNDRADWLRAELSDGSNGWIFNELLIVDGDPITLPIVTDLTEVGRVEAPMQAFNFSTGIGSPTCSNVPPDGLLIHTPAGAATVTFEINGVDISLGSTAYLRAIPGDRMIVDVLEGFATVTAEGETVAVPGGSRSTISLDVNGIADGTPTAAIGFDNAVITTVAVVVEVLIDDEIAVSTALSDEEIEDAIADSLRPTPGQWRLEYAETDVACDITDGIRFPVSTGSVAVSNDGMTMTTGFQSWFNDELIRTAPAIYSNTFQQAETDRIAGFDYTTTMIITSPDTIEGEIVGGLTFEGESCTMDNTFTITRIG